MLRITWTLWLLQDLLGWTKDKSEVEIADLVLKLRDKLVRATGPPAPAHLQHLLCLMLTLPPPSLVPPRSKPNGSSSS